MRHNVSAGNTDSTTNTTCHQQFNHWRNSCSQQEVCCSGNLYDWCTDEGPAENEHGSEGKLADADVVTYAHYEIPLQDFTADGYEEGSPRHHVSLEWCSRPSSNTKRRGGRRSTWERCGLTPGWTTAGSGWTLHHLQPSGATQRRGVLSISQ